MSNDTIKWQIHWGVQKYAAADVARLEQRLGRRAVGDDFLAAGVRPFEDNRIDGNLLTTAGLGRLTSLLIGGGGQAASNTATRIGVGDGTTAAAIGDTDLSASAGSTHRFFQPADSTYPSASGGVVTVKATFGTGDGNFAWNEFGIDIGTPTVSGGTTVNALLLNHKTSIAQGTKTSGQTWVATATITFS